MKIQLFHNKVREVYLNHTLYDAIPAPSHVMHEGSEEQASK